MLYYFTDVKVEFSTSEYTVSEGTEFIILTILRCGRFEEDVELVVTLTDVTATGMCV